MLLIQQSSTASSVWLNYCIECEEVDQFLCKTISSLLNLEVHFPHMSSDRFNLFFRQLKIVIQWPKYLNCKTIIQYHEGKKLKQSFMHKHPSVQQTLISKQIEMNAAKCFAVSIYSHVLSLYSYWKWVDEHRAQYAPYTNCHINANQLSGIWTETLTSLQRLYGAMWAWPMKKVLRLGHCAMWDSEIRNNTSTHK